MGKNDDTLTTGQLARRTGLSVDTIRHYERVGVLASAARGSNGYRQYPATAVQRVDLIRNALSVGFTLEELAGILRQRDSGAAPCRRVHSLANQKLAAIEKRIDELASLRDHLRALLEQWSATLRVTPDGEPARLLEDMTLRAVRAGKGAEPFKTSARKERSS
jgi:MerR family copper efflux transcriptional regulator